MKIGEKYSAQLKREPAEKLVRDVRRATRKQHPAEDKIGIVLEGLRGEVSIAALCRRDAIADRGRAAEERFAMRQAQSAPLVAELEAWLHAQLNRLSRGSKLAEATRYGPHHWRGRSEFLSDGRLEMDTSLVHREIRLAAATRKAALFAGSKGGGEKLGDCRQANPHGDPEWCCPSGLTDRCAGIDSEREGKPP